MTQRLNPTPNDVILTGVKQAMEVLGKRMDKVGMSYSEHFALVKKAGGTVNMFPYRQKTLTNGSLRALVTWAQALNVNLVARHLQDVAAEQYIQGAADVMAFATDTQRLHHMSPAFLCGKAGTSASLLARIRRDVAKNKTPDMMIDSARQIVEAAGGVLVLRMPPAMTKRERRLAARQTKETADV